LRACFGALLICTRQVKRLPDTVTRRQLLLMGSGLGFRGASSVSQPLLPDPLIAEAYQKAAELNVLAAVNPKVFPGYFSVCADGHGFGYGNTYPSLDGHQMSDALLWLGQPDVVKANWNYVKSFQHPDGRLPLAILPASAGKNIGPAGYPGVVDSNGGLYTHWVPGDPLAALASPTYIQNADAIFRRTLDRPWLVGQIASINLAADFLASLTTAAGAVKEMYVAKGHPEVKKRIEKEINDLRFGAKLYLPDQGKILLAVSDDDPWIFIGMACLRNMNQPDCEVRFLWVDPNARYNSAGTEIVSKAMATARELGREKIYAEVLKDPLEDAARVFVRCGFEETGETATCRTRLEKRLDDAGEAPLQEE
jgi:GNAT superfamily N-acetyltransferase